MVSNVSLDLMVRFSGLILCYEYRRSGYETMEDSDSSEGEDGANKIQEVGDDSIKKPVSVDAQGYPYGRMKSCLEDDVKLYAKELDPTGSWKSVPPGEKERFFKRLYAGMYLFFSRNKQHVCTHFQKLCLL